MSDIGDNNYDWLVSRMKSKDDEGPMHNENINNQTINNGNINGGGSLVRTNIPNNNLVKSNQNTNVSINNKNNGNLSYNPSDNYLNPYNNNFNNNLNNDMYDLNATKFKVKQEVQLTLNEEMSKEQKKDLPDDNFLRTMISKLLIKYNIDETMKQEIIQEIIWDLKGYGILQPLLNNEDITEIICCSYNNIWIEEKGKMKRTELSFANEKELRNLIDKIVQPLGRRIDDAQPYVNARLKDKSRVNIVIDPISAGGATLDIRKFAKTVFTIKDYIEKKTMIREMGELLKWLIIARKTIVVSGGTGSGKTTLLNCLSRFIPQDEAIITIEDLLELQLVQPCVRPLEARGPNAEGKGAITIRDLVINSLRMRPDRLIVGECRSIEVVDMLQAMNTGHDGSLTTIHANNAKDAIDRLTTMYQMAGLGVPDPAIKSQISSAIHVIVQAQRLDDGSRKITQISEVLGLGRRGADKNNDHVIDYDLDKKFLIKGVNNNEVYIQDIFRYDETEGEFVRTGWVPTFFKTLKHKGCKLELEDFSEQKFAV